MKKVLAVLAVAALSLFAVTGCRSTGEDNPQPVPKFTLEQRQAMGVEIIQAFQKNDYAKLAVHLSPEVKAQLSAAQFAEKNSEIRKGLGEIQSYDYLTELDAPIFKSLIWKVTFSRTDKEGKAVRQQILFRLVTGELGGKLVAIGFWFL
ncbi:MAG: hypothetical protein AB7F32_02775 [Victivallaceae bacterium]